VVSAVVRAIEHSRTIDKREPRLALQELCPDLVLEGATGDTMAQVFRHAHAERHACLRCLHGEPTANASYEETTAIRSGLSAAEIAAALQHASKTVSDELIAKAPEAVREIAAKHLGKDVCGYLSELERLFGATTSEPILLSVSFTSYLAGVFLASELLKDGTTQKWAEHRCAIRTYRRR
jgi:hypothetical protein